MEVYTLDSVLSRSEIVDDFESFIWTERQASYGDFQLVTASTVGSRNLLTIGTRMVISTSYRVMTIETVESKTDVEGRSLLIVSGRSLESILDDRVAKLTNSNLTTDPKWILTGTPGAIMRQIFQKICVDGVLNSADVIPFVVSGNPLPTDTIAESNGVITVELEPRSVYTALKELCDVYEMGFRLIRDPASNVLYFNVYAGCDRTTAQTVFPAVVFSPNLDNLEDLSEYNSIEQYKNVAYVFSKNGYEVVYNPEVNSSVSGFNRRVLLVQSDSDAVAGPGLTTTLRQEGYEALSKYRSVMVFDGKILPSGDYPYGLSINVGLTTGSWLAWDTNEIWDDAAGYWDDALGAELPPPTLDPYNGSAYNLGDLIEIQNSSGVTNYMRVVEQIFASDHEGERSYPTLALNLGITAASWLGWDTNDVWDTTAGYWNDL